MSLVQHSDCVDKVIIGGLDVHGRRGMPSRAFGKLNLFWDSERTTYRVQRIISIGIDYIVPVITDFPLSL